MSALDDCVVGNGTMHAAAREELAALRQRVSELEAMLRKAVNYSGAASLRRHGDRIVLVRNIGAPIYLADDGTGLPLLTDEARRALTEGK